MKRIFMLLAVILVLFSFSIVIADDFHISKSPQTINVNGVEKEFEVYNINGNNYFKLRDIAFVLNGTGSQFSVSYNETKRQIEAYTGKPYEPNGSEMNVGVDNSSLAHKSSHKLNINGVEKEITAYIIAQNNFFKLRELGEALNFKVDYIESTNTVIIESKEASIYANINSINIKEFNGYQYIEIVGDAPISVYNDFTIFDEGEDKRIVVDILNSNVNIDQNQIVVNKGNLLKIRIGNQGDNKNRFVFDLNSTTDYSVFQSTDKKILYVALSKGVSLESITNTTTIDDNTKIDLIESGDNIIIDESGDNALLINDSGDNNSTNSKSEDVKNNNSGEIKDSGEIATTEYTEKELKNRVKISSIKYSSDTNKIKVIGSKTFKYSDTLYDNPYKVVLDVKDAVLDITGPSVISPKNKIITEIKFYQYDQMTVRVEIFTSSKPAYKSAMKDKILELIVEEPSESQGVIYSSTNDKGIITLNNVSKSVFSTSTDSKKYTLTLKYNESKFNCGHETITISDKWIDNIKITKGKIVIEAESDYGFDIQDVGKNVVITISKEKKTTSSSTTSSSSTKTSSSTSTTSTTSSTSSTPTGSFENVLKSHINTVTRNSKFTVEKISDTRIKVGKIFINNTSGPELDLDALRVKSNIAINSKTNVLIYHTHTTEGYVESGAASNFHTTNTSLSVVGAGDTLERYLLMKNINVLHDRSRHDTSYNDSYDDSLSYLEKIFAKKKYDITIDLHRDAISSNLYYGPTTTINGESVAKLMFVMGSNALYEHPNWMENLKTAILIQNKAEEMYPGLFRDLSLVKWRYNEYFTPGGLLIEVGSTGNSMSEVNNAMKYLANVLAALDE